MNRFSAISNLLPTVPTSTICTPRRWSGVRLESRRVTVGPSLTHGRSQSRCSSTRRWVVCLGAVLVEIWGCMRDRGSRTLSWECQLALGSSTDQSQTASIIAGAHLGVVDLKLHESPSANGALLARSCCRKLHTGWCESFGSARERL